MRRLIQNGRRRVQAASLLEAVVAAVLFLTVFAAVMELLPRLATRDDDAFRIAEAEYRVGLVLEKYGSGMWPCGEYYETYDWGGIGVQVATYRCYDGMRCVTVTARIDGSSKRIIHKQLAQCSVQ